MERLSTAGSLESLHSDPGHMDSKPEPMSQAGLQRQLLVFRGARRSRDVSARQVAADNHTVDCDLGDRAAVESLTSKNDVQRVEEAPAQGESIGLLESVDGVGAGIPEECEVSEDALSHECNWIEFGERSNPKGEWPRIGQLVGSCDPAVHSARPHSGGDLWGANEKEIVVTDGDVIDMEVVGIL